MSQDTPQGPLTEAGCRDYFKRDLEARYSEVNVYFMASAEARSRLFASLNPEDDEEEEEEEEEDPGEPMLLAMYEHEMEQLHRKYEQVVQLEDQVVNRQQAREFPARMAVNIPETFARATVVINNDEEERSDVSYVEVFGAEPFVAPARNSRSTVLNLITQQVPACPSSGNAANQTRKSPWMGVLEHRPNGRGIF